jgi:hypothetical protein
MSRDQNYLHRMTCLFCINVLAEVALVRLFDCDNRLVDIIYKICPTMKFEIENEICPTICCTITVPVYCFFPF